MADLIKPYDGQSISYVHVLFEWEQEPDAIMYNIQLSSYSNFSNTLLDLNTSDGQSNSPKLLELEIFSYRFIFKLKCALF